MILRQGRLTGFGFLFFPLFLYIYYIYTQYIYTHTHQISMDASQSTLVPGGRSPTCGCMANWHENDKWLRFCWFGLFICRDSWWHVQWSSAWIDRDLVLFVESVGASALILCVVSCAACSPTVPLSWGHSAPSRAFEAQLCLRSHCHWIYCQGVGTRLQHLVNICQHN